MFIMIANVGLDLVAINGTHCLLINPATTGQERTGTKGGGRCYWATIDPQHLPATKESGPHPTSTYQRVYKLSIAIYLKEIADIDIVKSLWEVHIQLVNVIIWSAH